ncbi:MAG: Mce-associated rane protein [Cryptosporangiaceae bacterium]|jgi:Mce-associated membrane protein|nr:Mce-associated rane protein [Cryptosporangiaceae bacterium]
MLNLLTPRRAVTAVAVVVALAAVAFAATRAYDRHADASARADAVAAARQTIVNFTEIDPKAPDRSMDRVAAASTGDFKAEYAKDRATLRKAYADNALQAHGEVLEAGIASATRDSATVLLVVDQTVRKGKSGDPQLRHYRMRLDLARDRERWLVSALAFVS